MKNKHILITGLGFIGTHLAIELFNMGYEVTGLDIKHPDDNKLLMEFRDESNDETKDELEKRFHLMKVDLTDNSLYQEKYEFKDFDLIYHLASPIGVNNIMNNPNRTLRAANDINRFIDTIAEDFKIPVVYSSSSEVHGIGKINDRSNYNVKKVTDSPRWSYAAAKIHGEATFMYGYYPSAIVRFFNVVGKGQTAPGMVIPTFIKQAKANQVLTILEDGVRSYCDIREAVQYLIPIGLDLMNNKFKSKYNKQDFNIGNGDNNISAYNLATLIITLLKSKSIIERKDTKEAIPERILQQDKQLLLDMNIEKISLSDIINNLKD